MRGRYRSDVRRGAKHFRPPCRGDLPAAARDCEQHHRIDSRVSVVPGGRGTSGCTRPADPGGRRSLSIAACQRPQLLACSAVVRNALVAGVLLERCSSGTGPAAHRAVLSAQSAPSRLRLGFAARAPRLRRPLRIRVPDSGAGRPLSVWAGQWRGVDARFRRRYMGRAAGRNVG